MEKYFGSDIGLLFLINFIIKGLNKKTIFYLLYIKLISRKKYYFTIYDVTKSQSNEKILSK